MGALGAFNWALPCGGAYQGMLTKNRRNHSPPRYASSSFNIFRHVKYLYIHIYIYSVYSVYHLFSFYVAHFDNNHTLAQ